MKTKHGVTFWDAASLAKSVGSCAVQIDGKYMPARPLGWTEITMRLKAIWLVWKGRADVVTWPGGQ